MTSAVENALLSSAVPVDLEQLSAVRLCNWTRVEEGSDGTLVSKEGAGDVEGGRALFWAAAASQALA